METISRHWSHAERVLELPIVLEHLSQFCDTELGRELALGACPVFDFEQVQNRLELTREGVALHERHSVPVYSHARSVRSAIELASRAGIVPGDQLFRIAETLDAMGRLRRFLSGVREECPRIWKIADLLIDDPKLKQQLESCIGSDGEVLDTASDLLRKLRTQISNHNKKITDKLQSLINGVLRPYLQEPLYTRREGRFVIPIKAQYRGKVKGLVHDASSTGNTIYVEPEAIVGEMNRMREYEAQIAEEVERILAELSSAVGQIADDFLSSIDALGELDFIFARSKNALANQSAAPFLSQGHFIRIFDGHHPLLERSASIPATVEVGQKFRALLITGPNTGGKTVTLKILGLYSMMMGCGIFPPAQKVEYGPFSGVFADIGDEQSLQQSLSTFSAHLTNIADLFEKGKVGSLVLLDEIGAGTDPREGAALGKAILDQLLVRGMIVAASTHFGELKEFAQEDDRFCCAAMEFDLRTLKPTYHLVMGASGASHALEISRRYGLDEDVVSLAEKFLGCDAADEREKSYVLDALIANARKELHDAETVRSEVEELKKILEKERLSQKEKLDKLRFQLQQQTEETLREVRQTYRDLLQLVREANQSKTLTGTEVEMVLRKAREAQEKLTSLEVAETDSDVSESFSVGAMVAVRGYPRPFRIKEITKSGRLILELDHLKIEANPSDVSLLDVAAGKSKSVPRPSKSVSLPKPPNVPLEISLRRMRVEEAQIALDEYLDRVVLAGFHKVRIIHGKGDGVLRKFVHDLLSRRREVDRYELASHEEGGSGATVVWFK